MIVHPLENVVKRTRLGPLGRRGAFSPMPEPNPYQSPEPHDEQPHRQKQFGMRELLALMLWLCWTVGLLIGFMFAIRYFTSV